MVKNRLQWWLEHNKLMPPAQSGFSKGKSCMDNVSQLILNVDKAFMEKKHLLATFLDIKGAFDNIDPRAMAFKLADIGCPHNLVSFALFLTQHRLVYSELNTDHPRDSFRGVPQGGVLSPLLFILTIRDVAEGLSDHVKVSLFADDLAMFVSSKSPSWAARLLESSVRRVGFNLSMLGLELSPDKTVLLDFNRLGVGPGDVSIRVGNSLISSSPSTRFLGIFLDYRLTFTTHINHLRRRCGRAMSLMKFLCGTWWGTDPSTLLLLYKSFIRSILDYGSFIYQSDNRANSLAIERIQFRAIRIALGYRISTPVNILIAESTLPFLGDRALQLGCNFVAKNLQRSDTDTHDALTAFMDMLNKARPSSLRVLHSCIDILAPQLEKPFTLPNLSVFTHTFDTITLTVPYDTTLGIEVRDTPDPQASFSELLEDLGDRLLLFTDGSKTREGVGSACTTLDGRISVTRGIDPRASIFTAECMALGDALDAALESGQACVILTDSLSALQALNGVRIDAAVNPYVLDIKRKVLLLDSTPGRPQVEFFWVPAHVGILGNELADAKAKQAASAAPTGDYLLPFTDLYPIHKETAIMATRDTITNPEFPTGRRFFEFIYRPRAKPWFHGLRLDRSFIVTVNRIRANHYGLKSSLARKNFVDRPDCDCGAAHQDIDHVLWSCPLLTLHRPTLIRGLSNLGYHPPLTAESLVKLPHIAACNLIMDFLSSSNLQV